MASTVHKKVSKKVVNLNAKSAFKAKEKAMPKRAHKAIDFDDDDEDFAEFLAAMSAVALPLVQHLERIMTMLSKNELEVAKLKMATAKAIATKSPASASEWIKMESTKAAEDLKFRAELVSTLGVAVTAVIGKLELNSLLNKALDVKAVDAKARLTDADAQLAYAKAEEKNSETHDALTDITRILEMLRRDVQATKDSVRSVSEKMSENTEH